MSKIITIHQPDFLPWIGFFNKINNADVWIVLDHVENNPRDSAFWGRRVQMLVNRSPYWVSISLFKKIGIVGMPINQMFISKEKSKVFKTILQAYSKAPFFREYKLLIEDYFNSTEFFLVQRNMKFIQQIMELLDIKTEIVFSSDLKCKSKSTELLIEIIKKVDGTHYLAGGGAGSYQKDSLFEANNISLKFNNFKHPNYKQFNMKGEFVQGLSIIDSLMNIGADGLKEILKR